jgi:hypothetical protein
MIIYKIDTKNLINYEILKSYIVVKFIYYDDITILKDHLIKYYEYLSNKYPEVDYLTTYPGATDPLMIEQHLLALEELDLKLLIHSNGVQIDNVELFKDVTLAPHINLATKLLGLEKIQRSCFSNISKSCKSYGFESCSLTTQLRSNLKEVKSPIRYYQVQKDGVLTNESDRYSAGAYHSIRLSDLYKDYTIVLQDGKLKYYPNSN